MKYYCYLRNVQDLLTDEKNPFERRFGESLKGPIIPIGALVEYITKLREMFYVSVFCVCDGEGGEGCAF